MRAPGPSAPPGSDPPPLEIEVVLDRPAVAPGAEPDEPLAARVTLRPQRDAAKRPRLALTFLIDASASMHRFVLDPQQRSFWRRRAEQRGEISQQQADGRTGTVWTGQTLRELQHHVSTPMLSALRGVWRTLEALDPADRIAVLGFADHFGVVYEDAGQPDHAARLAAAKAGLARLGSGVDESGLGRGTRLAAALRYSLQQTAEHAGEPVLHRLVLVSDGIIEDAEACQPLFEAAAEQGAVITVIGVADEFDEELLMRVADLTRGGYHYAATAREVEQALVEEMGYLGAVVGRSAVLEVHPRGGAILQDVYPIAPALSEFHAVWVEGDVWRYRIGDLVADQQPAFLVRLAAPALPEGTAALAEVRVEASQPDSADTFTVHAPVTVVSTPEQLLLAARDEAVADTAHRLEIYLEERRAAAAAARGDVATSTRHLQAATRMLRARGEEGLAEEMEAVAADNAAGTRNLSRTKRMKAGTRRLGQGTRVLRDGSATQPDTRQLS